MPGVLSIIIIVIIIVLITHHLLLKVEMAFKRLQTARSLAFFFPRPSEICLLLMTFSSIKAKNNTPY